MILCQAFSDDEEFFEIGGGGARGQAQLIEIWADGGSAAISGKVIAFGINEDGDAELTGCSNQLLAEAGSERALGVVGKDEGVG